MKDKYKQISLTDREIKILLLGLGHIPMHIRFLDMGYKKTDNAIKELTKKLSE